MEQIEKGNEQYLLEPALENLHQESIKWNSEIELWKRELDFFQKLLDANSLKFKEKTDKQKEDHFQNLIIYYNGELLDEYKQLCRRHEKMLSNMLSGEDEKINETEYRVRHGDLKGKIESFESEFTKYKHEFFEFIEQVIE